MRYVAQVPSARPPKATPPPQRETLTVEPGQPLRLGVIADTHSAPHPGALSLMAKLAPNVILHAGDIGEPRILDDLAPIAKVLAVTGNIDARTRGLSERLLIDVKSGEQLLVRLLLLHIGIYGSKLLADAARLARAEGVSLVVCGHSHVPFIGVDRGITVFNPGSAGPRRFHLPIVLGTIDIQPTGIRMAHYDCVTGEPWAPPAV